MQYRDKRLATALALALTSAAPLAHAAGFALIEQNASGLGNAYAGAAAVAADASTVYFNPAGMTLLPDRQVVLAGHLVKLKAEFSGEAHFNDPAQTPISGGQGGDAGGLAFIPNAYFAQRITPDLYVGLGLNAPFGLKTEYDADWIGRYQAIESEVKTVNLNPSIAYRVSDSLSLGAGINLQWIEATLTHRQPLAAMVPPPSTLMKIQGDDTGWGYNLGVLWQATPATRVGLAYRSEIDYTLEGTSSTSDPIPVLNGPVTAAVTMPDSASLSMLHRLNPRWDLLADVTWTGWSDFDDLPIRGTVNKTTPENWDDILRYALGVTWRQSGRLSLRAGVAYDEAPVSDADRTPRIPDGARTWIAFGGQWRLDSASVLDFGYAHLFVNDPGLNNSDNGTTLTGDYDSSVDILSAQLTVNF